jgi:hypothetical protein
MCSGINRGSNDPGDPTAGGGIAALIAGVSQAAAQAPPGPGGATQFVLRLGEDYAYIRLGDLVNPWRFLRQLEGQPPLKLGTQGFNASLVERGDANPARHYTAFLFVGFWLPSLLAVLVLYGWEFLGFLRYGFHWSHEDMLSGCYGIRHGRLVRRYGPTILPSLIARDLAER